MSNQVQMDVAFARSVNDETSIDFDTHTRNFTSTLPINGSAHNFISLTDLNGDGRADVSFWNFLDFTTTSGIRMETWKVNTLFDREVAYHTESSNISNADLNGDGLSDVVRV